MCTFSQCSEVLIISLINLQMLLKALVGSKAMSAVSVTLFTNISRKVQQADMLSVLDWPDFYIS